MIRNSEEIVHYEMSNYFAISVCYIVSNISTTFILSDKLKSVRLRFAVITNIEHNPATTRTRRLCSYERIPGPLKPATHNPGCPAGYPGRLFACTMPLPAQLACLPPFSLLPASLSSLIGSFCPVS